jgi:hypothetical protein
MPCETNGAQGYIALIPGQHGTTRCDAVYTPTHVVANDQVERKGAPVVLFFSLTIFLSPLEVLFTKFDDLRLLREGGTHLANRW